ncbi:MAG: hypothetical protein V3W11_05985 [bacterium]
MRRAFYEILAVALAAMPASADLGQVVGSFSFPPGPGLGLARSNADLYVLAAGALNRVYRVNPASGSIRSSWTITWSPGSHGLAYSEPGYVWVGDLRDSYVYRASPTGSLYGSFAVPALAQGLAPEATGDGGAGTTALFTTRETPAQGFRHDLATGSILSSFSIPQPSPLDAAWDHRNLLLWLARGETPPFVYGFSTTGSVAASFAAPGRQPVGLTYYGQYLWVTDNDNNRIYQVHCPTGIGVEAASFGKVRALFK